MKTFSQSELAYKLMIAANLSKEAADYYIDFIFENSCKKIKNKTEAHHILPRSLFPEYEKEKWNIANLTNYNHFKAHFLLCSGKNGKMLNAISRMRHGSIFEMLSPNELDLVSKEYDSIRTEVRIAQSESKINFYSNPENRKAASLRALKYYSEPENLEKLKITLNKPETKAKISTISKAWFSIEENKLKHKEAVNLVTSTEKYSKNISKAVTLSWENPSIRETHIKSRRKGYHWDNKEMLYNLWIQYNKPKHVSFRKTLTSLGHPIKTSLQALVGYFISIEVIDENI